MGKLRKTMEDVGCTPSKEWTIYVVIVMALGGGAVGLYLYRGLSFLLLLPAILFVLFTFLYFARYPRLNRERLNRMGDEFVRLFTFFGIYVNDGFNVYNALEAIQAYAGPEFKKLLKKLLLDIESDKSVTPFVTFASALESVQIKEVMVSVYQMVDEGGGGAYITQFQHLFGSLSEQRHQANREKRIGALENLSFLPLAGSGIAMLVMTMAIVQIMGGIMYVI